jgi:MBG domain
MTGPRSTTVHPHRRRGRRLLPFLIAMALGPLACTSDQTTGPSSGSTESPFVAASGPLPRARNRSAQVAARAMITRWSHTSTSTRPSFSVSGTGPSVLILADIANAQTTQALYDTLRAAGFQVTVQDSEYAWNPATVPLDGFSAVVHLVGFTYDSLMSPTAQSALTSFVQNGGGYVGGQWNGYRRLSQPDMAELVFQSMANNSDGPAQTCSGCDMTYQTVAGQESHPVLAGIPSSFVFHADGHDADTLVHFASQQPTVLMHVPNGGPAVTVRDFGTGKVVNFSFAPNYPYNDFGDLVEPTTLLDSHIKALYVNAVRWVSASANAGQAAPQTIAFAPLSNKVFGDADFTIAASTTSGLPASFTATGDCSVAGTSVSITAAGSCTITAHQAGNDDFQPADDVSQSFTIAKAPATITVGTEFTYDGTPKNASVTTSPAGLSGLSVSYTLNGSPVTQPTNAGIYQVSASLNNPNYQAPTKAGTLTILQAAPVLHWTPANLSTGTPLGPSQLNATATGIGGAALAGSFGYTPAAGTQFNTAGTISLSVLFAPSNANYAAASMSASINVSGAMNFSGFYAPVRNMPYVNTAMAGSAIPMKFAIGGFRGLQVLQANSPSSVAVACPAGAPENAVRASIAPRGGLQSLGSSYTYVWKTNASWAGTCRKFQLTLADGSTHEALFRFMRAPKGNIFGRLLGH